MPDASGGISPMATAAWGDPRQGRWPRAAYLHFPFCHHHCHYCNFTVAPWNPQLADQWLAALEKELSFLSHPQPVQTLYFGGGTPSLIPPDQWDAWCRIVRYWLPLEPGAEWTIEANPADIDQQACRRMADQGVNRISLGGQSFDRGKLQRLDRDHTGDQLKQAIDLASRWFPEVSLDLIFAAPLETLPEWQRDLEQAIASPIQHLSTYGLTYEKGARLWSLRERGEVHSVAEGEELEMYLWLHHRLRDAGWDHYEISNACLPGHRSRHNQVYWSDQRWWAFGPGAARFVGRTRSVNHRSTRHFLKLLDAGQSGVAEREWLDDQALARDRFVFGLRRLEGIVWSEFQKACPAPLCEAIEGLVEKHRHEGWMELHEDRLRLTESGLVISDALWPAYYQVGVG